MNQAKFFFQKPKWREREDITKITISKKYNCTLELNKYILHAKYKTWWSRKFSYLNSILIIEQI